MGVKLQNSRRLYLYVHIIYIYIKCKIAFVYNRNKRHRKKKRQRWERIYMYMYIEIFMNISITFSSFAVLQIVCKIAPFLEYPIIISNSWGYCWLKLHVNSVSSLFYIPLFRTQNKGISCRISLSALSVYVSQS